MKSCVVSCLFFLLFSPLLPHSTAALFCHLGKNNACENFICECDRKAAMCFAEAGYNEGNAHLPSGRCK